MLTAIGALFYQKEENMEKKDLKKLLASLGIASLIAAGGSMAIPGIAATGSGWTADKEGAGSAEQAVTDSTEEVKKQAGEAADAAVEEAKKKTSEAVDTAVDEVKKKAGDSGWTATK